MIEEEEQPYHILIKDFSPFILNQTLHCDRKYIFSSCFQSVSAAQILETHVYDCFEINGK